MYDEQGRVYQSVQHDIDQNNGADNGTLVTYTWYDHRGNVIESKAPGGLVTKYSYDGAGRLVETSETDGESGMSWAVAGNVSGDIVLQQSMSIYDNNGNVIFSVEKLRNYQYLGLGELVTAIDPNSLANTGFSFDEARIQLCWELVR